MRLPPSWGIPGGSAVKNLPAMQETWLQSLDQEDPLEEVMATHSSILAWRMPWTEDLLTSLRPHRPIPSLQGLGYDTQTCGNTTFSPQQREFQNAII